MRLPDVTVVVPVYNARPYLRRCLSSVLGQSLGPQRLELIAVDDGSTDGSDRVLSRWARRHPGTVRVLRQANSGGPAAPCNRALDVAAGRYVFFLGADDYLGAEALERLVEMADRYGSDVVAGRVVGVNGRFVHQGIFTRDEPEIRLADSALPWALTNVKLFNRALIDQHGVRYLEDMRLGSDLPFTLEACRRAHRVSVLASYDCYYAVRRLDAGNITHVSGATDRLACLRRLVDVTVRLLGPGKDRDAVLARLFSHEVTVLLRQDLPRCRPALQQRIVDTVREIASAHLTDDITVRLPVDTALAVSAAVHGALDDLTAMLRHDADSGTPPTIPDGGRVIAGYPGHRSRPAAFDVTTHAAQWAARRDVVAAGWRRGRRPALRLRLRGRPGETVLRIGEAAAPVGAAAAVEVEVRGLVAASTATGARFPVRAEVGGAAGSGDAPVRAPGLRPPRPLLCRRAARLYAVGLVRSDAGHLMLSVVPVTPARIMAAVRARLRRALRR